MSECQCESHQVQIREPALEARMEMMTNYARTGDVVGLYSSIKMDPQLLKDMDEIQFIHTPLHEAAAFGQTGFALEILDLMPSFGKKLNPEGLSPLHVALEHKNITTARSLVRKDKQLVRVKGKAGFTPLHLAAKIACADNDDELEILADFLHECPESIHDLNSKLQTAVHVALECNSDGSSALLLNWLTRTSKESILAVKDLDGNTALHAAVQYDRVKEVKVLVKLVKLNPKNVSGKTPLDIAREHPGEMVKTLIHAGARRANQLPKVHSKGQYLLSEVNTWEDLFRGYYFTYKDFVVNLREDIMVIAVLIATATYQAVLQPPGGIYQPNGSGHLAMSDALISHMSDGAGKMVMKRPDYRHFMPANTAAFTLSIAMILLVLQGRPSNVFLLLCLIFLTYSYLSAMNVISDCGALTKSMFVICWSVIGSVFVIKLSLTFVKALADEVWWMPRLSIKVSNSILDRPVGRWLQTNIPVVPKVMQQYHLIKY